MSRALAVALMLAAGSCGGTQKTDEPAPRHARVQHDDDSPGGGTPIKFGDDAPPPSSKPDDPPPTPPADPAPVVVKDPAPVTPAPVAASDEMDCRKLVDHVFEIMMREIGKNMSPDERRAMESSKGEMIKACETELAKSTNDSEKNKRIYACIMRAQSIAEVQKCSELK